MTEKEDENMVDEKELSVIEEILNCKGKVFSHAFDIPFIERKLVVHWQLLEANEIPDINIPENFQSLSNREKSQILIQINEKKAWAMIEKASKKGKIPKKSKISKKEWDGLERYFPDVYNEIVGHITGSTRRFAESFIGGQGKISSR